MATAALRLLACAFFSAGAAAPPTCINAVACEKDQEGAVRAVSFMQKAMLRGPASLPAKPGLPRGYHSSDAIVQRLQELAAGDGACKAPLTAEWVSDTSPDAPPLSRLFTVRLGAAKAPKRLFVVANEHARELITAEVALRFIEDACADDSELLSLLSHVRITVVPIVNLRGREQVENGATCLRSTVDEGEGLIDLNRNADVDFEASEDHGSEPFSTYQARIIRDIAAAEQPVAFLDLHSGAESLMVSWGNRPYTTVDYPDQLRLLELIKARWCPKCPVGSNRVVIKYPNPGEIIDHMYLNQKVKYSTLWEVWVGNSDEGLPRWTDQPCMLQFNPSPEQLGGVLVRWSGAIQSFAAFVHHNVTTDERTSPSTKQVSSLTGVGSVILPEAPMPPPDSLTT
mmetsp:Transcript_105861/g.297653  ORF Transcript_105861/g.297653 Transcript_105861/m.297653 type:complete len:399 (+) Transcript_105861:81-1277(+)